ncbi:glutamate receptor ionotropic, kainate 2-like isoform X1 [Argiope bruennichi]|uniref:glutamate receptor ionotropic, kainate 2-like isoform X1 n=1 Tax=Argiope bruennichi TaxID=94029 RepID=UPI002494DC69|nr:glutamate receptor ionotropic, kainate 2-like isoform X1 [Argiope bruennichi]
MGTTVDVFRVALLFLNLGLRYSLPEVIIIGGLFENFDDDREMAFRYAVDRINADDAVLPKSKLSAKIERLKPQSSFHAAKSVCFLVGEGVVAIFGPNSVASSALVRSTASALHIPHLESHWDLERGAKAPFTISLFPRSLGTAIYDLVKSKNWRSFTIIYEDAEELMKLQELMKLRNNKEVKISLQQFTVDFQYNKILKDIKKKGETNIVLEVPTSRIKDVLSEAQKAGMLTEYHNYLITSLDFHTLDLTPFQHSRSNISAFRIVSPESQYYGREARTWIFGRKENSLKKEIPLTTETALLVDAVNLYAKALHAVSEVQTISSRSVSCDSPGLWPYGSDLIEAIKKVRFKGLTGDVQIGNQGQRIHFTFDLLELKPKGTVKVGEWDTKNHLVYTRNYSKDYSEAKDNLQNITLRVTSKESFPYTIIKKGDYLSGNQRYEGFCVDLIHEICNRLHCKYEYRIVADESYGKKYDNGTWDGMIGEVINREVDLAIGDLTITQEREEFVDFTMPFMNLGISILFKKPTKSNPKLFSFLAPFSFEVWVYMATAYLGVSLLLFVLARFSPYEWVSPHPCNPKTEYLENTFSLLNSFWFTIGSLMQQGSDIAPRATSTRTVAALWWFFTLIMISSYTANLAAFLTAERMKSPIESADDLAKQSEIQYGCVERGSTRSFFESSQLQPYKRMWSVMQSAQPNVFTKDNPEGIERVRKGNYAFLMESTTIEYYTERDCDLTQIGGLLDSKGYGIATPPGSPYRALISSEILRLQEEGFLHVLKDKWWKSETKCKDETKKKTSSASELDLPNVGGVFVVLLAGLGMAAIVAVFEFIWRTKKIPRDERRMVLLEMLHELQDICKCRGSSRPAPNYLDGDFSPGSTDNGFVMHSATSFNTVSSQDFLS